MKIVITNTTMANGGDAAIVYSMIDILRRTFGTNTSISVMDSLASTTKKYYPDIDIRQLISIHRRSTDQKPAGIMSRLLRILKRYRLSTTLALRARGMDVSRLLLTKDEHQIIRDYAEAGMVISVGGTYLVDVYDFSPRLLEFDIALSYGKRPLFFTQSLGPFKKPGLNERVKQYFHKSPLILLRDQKSHASLDLLGVDRQKMHVLADGVFGLAQQDTLRTAANSSRPIRRVIISVRNWPFFREGESAAGMDRYKSGIAKAVEQLISKLDCEILFISTCQGIPEYHVADSAVAAEIAARIPAEIAKGRVRIDHDFHNPIDLFKSIGEYDVVIATRMHMAILALSAGVPVLPIAYEFKTAELFKRLGMEKWVTAIEDVTADHFPALVNRFIEALPEIRRPLFEAVENERRLALTAGPLLKAAALDA